MNEPNNGPTDSEGFPRCWNCGHFDFGPCDNGDLLCNGCDACWQDAPPSLRGKVLTAAEINSLKGGAA